MAGSKKTKLSLGGLIVVALAFVANHFLGTAKAAPEKNDPSTPAVSQPANPTPSVTTPGVAKSTEKPAAKPVAKPKADPGPGFTSRRSLESHFEKHGHEFGHKTVAEYLAMAQELRDKEVSSRVLEETRSDGVITRFDRDTGAFIAYHKDRSIRTLFKPNDGEAYFRRQLKRDD